MKRSTIIALFFWFYLPALVEANEGGLRGLADDTYWKVGGSVDADVHVPKKCFSEDASVLVKGQGFTAMKHLQVGDLIFTGENYQPIYAFGHYDRTSQAEFLEIQTYHFSLEISPEHLVFVDGKKRPVRADAVKVGDTLQGAQVMKIGTIEKTGLYAPLTASGTLIVDGIRTSTYVSLQDSHNVKLKSGHEVMSQHNFVHMMLSPFRMMCIGVSSNLCKHDSGTPGFIDYGIRLAQWCDGLNIVAQIVLFTIFIVIGGIFMTFESIFGATFAPAAMVGTVTLLKAAPRFLRQVKPKSS